MSLQVPTTEELASFRVIATIAASNQHWRKLGGSGTEEQIVATILSVMLLARELGISPMSAISGGINNIQGKFEISARLMNQLMRKQGHQLEVRILTNEVCKIWGKRKDTGEEMEAAYHIEEARRAGLIKEYGGWAKNPQDMLFARTISRLVRRLCPDCIGGCYIEGELQEAIEKKTVDAPEMPEIEINPVAQISNLPIVHQLDFEIPADISEETINEYMQTNSESCGISVQTLIQGANKRPEAFVNALRRWEDNMAEKPILESQEPEMAEA